MTEELEQELNQLTKLVDWDSGIRNPEIDREKGWIQFWRKGLQQASEIRINFRTVNGKIQVRSATHFHGIDREGIDLYQSKEVERLKVRIENALAQELLVAVEA